MSHADARTLDDLAASRRVSRRALAHIDGCVGCRRAAAERGVSGTTISAALAAAPVPRRAFVAAAVLAGCAAVAAVALPLRGAAFGFLEIFEPHRVAAVPLTLDELRSLSRMPNLSAYASTREVHTSTAVTFDNPRAAMAAAGFSLRQPAYLPAGIGVASYIVNSRSTQLLTFRPRTGSGRAPERVALPPDIVGSTLLIDLAPSVVATYLTPASAADQQRVRRAMETMATSAAHDAANARAENSTSGGQQAEITVVHRLDDKVSRHNTIFVSYGGTIRVREGAPRTPANLTGSFSGLPLVVVQMPVPRISSTGVSVARLAAVMLRAPGIPPRVAAAFASLGDLSTTLPIPVPIDRAYTQPVVVDGVPGVGLGDDTGIGAAVIWQKSGMLYAVFAPRTAHDVLAIANSLR